LAAAKIGAMKTRVLLTLAAVLATCAPIGAHAHHCESKLVAHGYTADLFDLGTVGTIACLFDDGHTAPVDYRLLSPGATSVLIQYLTDVGPKLPSTTGYLDGLGFNHFPVTYNRYDVGANLGYAYQTEIIPIPDGATASGCLTFTFKLGEDDSGVEDYEINRYHTVDASCPDYP
jgi:hypothetical protein